jgi:hypothetical protein
VRTRFIWDFLKLSLLYPLKWFFSVGMRMLILILKSMCLREEPGNRRMFEVVEAHFRAFSLLFPNLKA